MKPGDLVILDPIMWVNRNSGLTLWKKKVSTLEELHSGGNLDSCGSITLDDVCLVIARVPALNGIPGTETDYVLLLVGVQLGWNSVHWFQEIQSDG